VSRADPDFRTGNGANGGTLKAMNNTAASAIADAITNQEGPGAGTLASRQNNPGNLRFAHQTNAVLGDGGFARFPSPADGRAALIAQIQLDAERGHDAAGKPIVTVADLISSWAPSSENDTGAYISSVVSQTGYSADDELNSLGGGAADPLFGSEAGSAVGLVDLITSGGSTTEIVAGVAAAGALWLVYRLVFG
jgi:hypothetical protein